MRFYKFLTCLLLSFSFVSCASSAPTDTRSDKERIFDTVLKECGMTLAKKHQLAQSGAGGRLMYEIEGMFLAFHTYKALTRDEARVLLLDCAQEVITQVNANPEIKQYLLPGGFNEKSVQIQIYIQPNHKRNCHPDIGVCSYNFGKIVYDTRHADKEKWGYVSSESETYEEALALNQAYLEKGSNAL